MTILQPLSNWLEQQGISQFLIEAIHFSVALVLLALLGGLLSWVARRFQVQSSLG